MTSIPALGRERRDEGVGGATLPVWELGLLRRAELWGPATLGKVHVGRLSTPTDGRVTRADGRAPADPCEPGNPIDAVVHDVPQAGKDAPGCEDSGDLGSRDVHVEPVHGVAG
jgi:hypothetical protein